MQRARAGLRPMVMRFGTARLLLAACSTLPLVACGSVASQHARTGSPGTRAQASAHGTPARVTPVRGTCGPPSPRHAWAVDVTRTGRLLWKTPLETRWRYCRAEPAVPGAAAPLLAYQAASGGLA